MFESGPDGSERPRSPPTWPGRRLPALHAVPGWHADHPGRPGRSARSTGPGPGLPVRHCIAEHAVCWAAGAPAARRRRVRARLRTAVTA
ncbi:hypothetical protein HBB16_02435 [Pseudonocardia sp. MCCB 268]|nr:hypothetical protein [Pseudonocardia cytotoxica]